MSAEKRSGSETKASVQCVLDSAQTTATRGTDGMLTISFRFTRAVLGLDLEICGRCVGCFVIGATQNCKFVDELKKLDKQNQ